MKSRFNIGILCLHLLVFFTIGCKTRVKVAKPEEKYIPKTQFEKVESLINIPVEISVPALEKTMNKYTEGVLYEDKSFDDNDGDNLKCKVTKYKDFKLDALENRIKVDVPLNIVGTYKKLGATFGFTATITITYVTEIAFKDSWKLKTVTHSNGYKWIKSPKVDVGLFELPVTFIADAVIKGQTSYINDMIDESIKEYVSLKEYIMPAVKAMAEPMNVSETYKTWFVITPLQAYTTQLNAANKKIKATIGLKANIETFIGDKPALPEVKDPLPMKAVDELKDDFNLGIVVVTSYEAASEILKKEFVTSGYEYVDGKRKIGFTKMNLYGQGEKMVVEVAMTGSVNGTVYLIGTPVYDEKFKAIKIINVDFEVDSKSKLMRSSNWLLHGAFAKMIEKNLVFPLGDQLETSKKDAQEYLKNYEVSEGIFLNGEIKTIETGKVYLIESAIVSVVNVVGTMGLKVKSLNY
ncbi:MAG: DUF4403 family protein [Flavobacteriales bacterium]